MRFEPFLALLFTACVWETDLPVDEGRELLITDVASLEELSFERAMRTSNLDPLPWLESWSRHLDRERATKFDAQITCRWLRADEGNRCDPSCTKCASRKLPLSKAPFRLIAIANRTDLSTLPDRAADGGEGRLVYALTDEANVPLPFTVIFEYAQEGSALSWTQRWHALATAADFRTELVRLTETFMTKLAQVRTADALTGPMLMHQFEMKNGLVPVPVRNTPDWKRVDEGEVTAYASAHSAAIEDGTAVLPREWWADASSPDDPVPAYATEALVRGTCGGCHAEGFQIDPQDPKKRSRFLTEDLHRRARWMQILLAR